MQQLFHYFDNLLPSQHRHRPRSHLNKNVQLHEKSLKGRQFLAEVASAAEGWRDVFDKIEEKNGGYKSFFLFSLPCAAVCIFLGYSLIESFYYCEEEVFPYYKDTRYSLFSTYNNETIKSCDN